MREKLKLQAATVLYALLYLDMSTDPAEMDLLSASYFMYMRVVN